MMTGQDASQAQGEVGYQLQMATGAWTRVLVERQEAEEAVSNPANTITAMRPVYLTAPGATAQDGVEQAAINQNDAMRQELAHIGNLVTDLARAMKVDQANDDGSWPDIAGRIQRLIAAAQAPTPTIPAGMVVTEAMLTAGAQVLTGHDAQKQTWTQVAASVFAAMLAAAPKQAEQQGVPVAEKMGRLYAWQHLGIAWEHLERISQAELVAAFQCAVDWLNQPLAARKAALNAPTGAVEKGAAK